MTAPQTGLGFYGWTAIVPTVLVMLFITNGLTVGGIAAFDPVMISQLGVPRDQIKFGDTLQLAVTAVLTVLSGWLADRFGVRLVMWMGLAALGWSFYALGHVETLVDYWWSRVWMGIGLSGCGMAICMVAVSRWFATSRGLAIGVVLAGTSFGNAFLPRIFTDLIAANGPRGASLYALAMIAILPWVVWFAVREWPRDKGLKAYGADAVGNEKLVTGEELSYLQILSRREFWLMGIAAFGTFYAILAVNNNMILHMQDLKVPPKVGSLMAIPLFMAGFVGKVAAGWLTDRLGRKPVWLLCLGLMLLGVLMLSSMRAGWVPVAAFVMGLGWGANYTLLQAVAADLFGTRSLGKVMGAVTVLDAGGGALGPWVTSKFAVATGDYQLGFWVVAGLVALALLSASLLRIVTPDLVARQATR